MQEFKFLKDLLRKNDIKFDEVITKEDDIMRLLVTKNENEAFSVIYGIGTYGNQLGLLETATIFNNSIVSEPKGNQTADLAFIDILKFLER